MKTLLFIFGTRPETIKMAPIIHEAKQRNMKAIICLTGQHKEMVNYLLDFFNLKADYNANIMLEKQTLSYITSECLMKLSSIISKVKPDFTLVQGDTNSTFSGALASFYNKTPIIHIEAGLRSFNNAMPFPEEMNRVLTSRLANYHFTPSKTATQNLKNEGLNKNIFNVGNSVIDSLNLTLELCKKTNLKLPNNISKISSKKQIILVTCHRRENWGAPLENICKAILKISTHPNIQIIFSYHLNPIVKETVLTILSNKKSITLVPPLNYPALILIMKQSKIIITDSGGIQEEAPYLGKPVLVLRDVTERTEGVESNNCILVGSNMNNIVEAVNKLINTPMFYEQSSKTNNLYGDGSTSKKICDHIETFNV